ncbi:hypothetical protein C9374_010340 [Naegleria lovaniensis]|uniref:Trafficking protein particle complex subunit 12 n=1 Tax=Naegleria lovaniensis TaxID=51637 RepID=A0AA88GEB5_NAELO|nr:uncharacterized protein C9374_010340 [Naegleria lovaniensis]KAG2374966.1 hypothetical protein C9374_010340 [Naegleria lovaniensis]
MNNYMTNSNPTISHPLENPSSPNTTSSTTGIPYNSSMHRSISQASGLGQQPLQAFTSSPSVGGSSALHSSHSSSNLSSPLLSSHSSPTFLPSSVSDHPTTATTTTPTNVRSSTMYGVGAISLSQQEAVKNFLKNREFPPRLVKRMQDIKAPSLDGCVELGQSESWKEMLKLCEKQLQLPGRPHELLQWRLCQLVSLLRLNIGDYAQQCVDMMGDLENNSSYFYEKYPNIYNTSGANSRSGNMMPFSILIIKAIIPLIQYLRNPTSQQQQQQQVIQQQQSNPNLPPLPSVTDGSAIAMDRLYALLKVCSDQIKDENGKHTGGILYSKRAKMHSKITISYTPFEGSQEEWRIREQRVVFFIVTCHIARKEYYLALQLSEKMLKYYAPMEKTDFESYQRLESLVGCLYLQQGILKPAKEHFLNVEKRAINPERSVIVRSNNGYMKFALGYYADACKDFDFILKELDPFCVNAANNKAICELYMCELTKAIETLEEFIRQDPSRTLEETLVHNLCILYDLESTESNEKKMVISSLAHRFRGDDFVNWMIK